MSRPHWGILVVVLYIITGFFIASRTLYAQAGEALPGPELAEGPPPVSDGSSINESSVNESSFIIGEPAEIPAVNPGSSVLVVLRMVLVLALAALAIYGVVFFIKRLARPRELRDPHLKILARVPLGNDVFAAVVSVGSKAWLVGGGSGGVNLISEISEVESLETMLLDDARKSAEAGGRRVLDFRSLLSRMGGDREGDDAAGNSGADNLRKQRERLKRL